jgi:hypothetical protein
LVERVAAMRYTLLRQVVHHYPRNLTGEADTLLHGAARVEEQADRARNVPYRNLTVSA